MLTISRRRTLYIVSGFQVWACRAKKKARGRSSIVCVSRVSKSIYIYILVFNNIYIYIIYIPCSVCMYDKCERVDVRASRVKCWPTSNKIVSTIPKKFLLPFTPPLSFFSPPTSQLFPEFLFLLLSSFLLPRASIAIRTAVQGATNGKKRKKNQDDHSRDLRFPIPIRLIP